MFSSLKRAVGWNRQVDPIVEQAKKLDNAMVAGNYKKFMQILQQDDNQDNQYDRFLNNRNEQIRAELDKVLSAGQPVLELIIGYTQESYRQRVYEVVFMGDGSRCHNNRKPVGHALTRLCFAYINPITDGKQKILLELFKRNLTLEKEDDTKYYRDVIAKLP